jgi:hypothetical protein
MNAVTLKFTSTSLKTRSQACERPNGFVVPVQECVIGTGGILYVFIYLEWDKSVRSNVHMSGVLKGSLRKRNDPAFRCLASSHTHILWPFYLRSIPLSFRSTLLETFFS